MNLNLNVPVRLLLLCLLWQESPCLASKEPGHSIQLPFSFVENRGQADARVRYIGTGARFKAWFRDDGIVFQQGEAVTRLRFAGGRRKPVLRTGDPLGATATYLRGRESAAWRSGLPLYGSLTYTRVWPGIEIRFKADQAGTKAEYLIAPGASPAEIRLRFKGRPSIEPDGSLVVSNGSGEFRESAPLIYQNEGARRVPVRGAFIRREDGCIGFSVPVYDRTRPLVIDPNILFSGYFGGSAQSTITAIAVNSWFNTIVAGWTVGTDLPATGGVRSRSAGGVDAFVAGFSPDGGKLLFCTYLGGSGDDRAFGLAVDSANNTYVTGWTSSVDFPVAGGLQNRLKGARDAFVAKLNRTGTAFVYSTYLGGTGADTGNAIVLNRDNSVLLIGDTTSRDLPVTAGVVQPLPGGTQDAFVAKLSAAGSLSWLTYCGGSGTEHGAALALDSGGRIFIAGSTSSPDFPVVRPFQPHTGGGQDGFVAKLASDASSLIFSTYLGGSGGIPGSPEGVNAVVLGRDGNPVLAGVTSSRNFPVTSGTLQTSFGGGQTDGFLTRVDQNTGAVISSMYVGGSGDDSISGMVADVHTDLFWITGYTGSPDFPSQNPTQAVLGGGLDAFVANIGFSRLLCSGYFGGPGNDSGTAVAIDSLSNVAFAVETSYRKLPVQGSVGAGQGTPLTSYFARMAANYTLAVANMPAFRFDVWHNTGYNGPNTTLGTASFGATGDVPLMGDWDGSGVKRLGVFRNGLWILDTNGNSLLDAGDRTIQFGQPGDVPVLGDWDGTGRVKLGLFRQGVFILDLSGHLSGTSTGVADATFPFGLPGDLPVVADWNGSGTTKAGVFRAGQWLVDFLGTRSATTTYRYGQAGDIPVVGDWIGTGIANQIGVYRQGLWILNSPGGNTMLNGGLYELYVSFGGPSYKPLVF